MRAVILDVQTKQTFIVDGPSTFDFVDGNYACDCNRHPGVGTASQDGVCEGSRRFIVVEADITDPEDFPASLLELNSGYPRTLLAQYGIR